MKKIEPDDYFNNGFIETARFGKTVVTHNNMTEEQHKQFILSLANRYTEEKDKIDALIEKIKEKLCLVNPLVLFNFLTSMNTMMLMRPEVTSELEISNDVNHQLKSVEYIQSLLVSMQHDKDAELNEVDQEPICYEIRNLCSELYSKLPYFYMLWAARQQETGDISREDEEYIIFAQMMSQVRGEQYQAFRIPILKKLLLPQEELLNEIYGLNVEDIILGLETMEKNLSSGRLDAMKALCDQMDMLDLFDDEPDETYIEKSQEITLKAIGTALFEVKENTAWTDTFINDLSLSIGSDNSFLTHEEFSGWPIWNLPIQYKPFIKIEEIVYCFDYYTLFDNFYVALQKAVRTHGKDFCDRWNEAQGHSSEKIVGSIFECLLPGCNVHYSNYYPIKKKDSAENDILIEYKDVLLIVEVKAGTIVYTPAMMDFQAHKRSFEALVEKAEKQCLRVKKYILDSPDKKISFYSDDSLDTESFLLNREQFNQIYMFDVTISDFNEFASQMEKVKIANAHEDIIAISLNDLWVYKCFFDNPLQFIHFIKQRTIATETVEIATSDELDHLGMYISHNMYSLQAKDIGNGNHVNFMGYRDKIDKYFSSIHIGKKYDKPSQIIPKEIQTIMNIELDKEDNVTLFINFLLDLSMDSRKAFAESISKLAGRERELGRMLPAMHFGDVTFALFVEIPNISIITNEKKEEYVLANLSQNQRDECWSITIALDKNDNILDVYHKLFSQDDIPKDRRDELKAYGKQIVENRIEQYLVTNHKKKIYPNDPCICGSGKKYKKCCGRI